MKDLLIEGGPVFWALLTFSTIALTVIIFKSWQFIHIKALSHHGAALALTHLKQGEQAHALMAVQNQANPCARVIRAGLSEFNESKLSVDEIKTECWRQARRIATELQSYLRILEVIATLAPLLGLFGTVLGMIEAFEAMELAGAKVDPSTLSGGISKALLTTAAGLAVAIPVSLFLSWFERKVECITNDMQDYLEQLFQIKAHLSLGVKASKNASKTAESA